MRQILVNIILLVGAFVVVLMLTFPFELAATKILYPRIEAATGIVANASSIRPGFPFSIVAKNVTLSTALGRNIIGEQIPRISVTPGIGLLLGNRDAAVNVDFQTGSASIAVDESHYRLELNAISLSVLNAMMGASTCTTSGRLNAAGDFSTEQKKGDFSLTFTDVAASGIRFLGIEFPDLRLGEGKVNLKIADGRVEIQEARSSGGNVGVNISGLIGLAPALRDSVLSLILTITPSQEVQSAFGPTTSEMIARIKKPDGSIHISINGTAAKPLTGFR